MKRKQRVTIGLKNLVNCFDVTSLIISLLYQRHFCWLLKTICWYEKIQLFINLICVNVWCFAVRILLFFVLWRPRLCFFFFTIMVWFHCLHWLPSYFFLGLKFDRCFGTTIWVFFRCYNFSTVSCVEFLVPFFAPEIPLFFFGAKNCFMRQWT